MTTAGVPSRSRKAAVAAALALAVGAPSVGCAADRYMGVALAPGGDPQLQHLARRARAGDRDAQFALAQHFESAGDLGRAERLYLMASLDRGGNRVAYSPPQSGDRRGGATIVNQGPASAGLPAARQRWIAVRSERLAQEAARSAPGEVSLDVYLARRLAGDRQLGSAAALDLPVESISGPLRIRARLRGDEMPQPRHELCAALGAVVTHYRDFGFERCAAWRYVQPANPAAEPVYALDYADRYLESEEYRSLSPQSFYRAPFRSRTGLFAYRDLCGEFTTFDVRLGSGRTYRILIGETQDRRAGSTRPRGCR